MKQIAFLKKRSGLSREAFIQLYEEEHAKLIARLLPFYLDYRRAYPLAANPAVPFQHDAIMEMRFAGPEEQAAMGRRIAEPEVAEAMRLDEERLFERAAMVMFTVEEHGAPAGAETHQRGRTLILAQKMPDASREDLIEQCENSFAPALLSRLAAGGLREPMSFCRNYPVPGGTFKMPHLDTAACPVDFDAIIEIGFAEPTDHESFGVLVDDGTVADLLAGGAGVVAPDCTVCLHVEEYRSCSLAEPPHGITRRIEP